MKDEWGCCGGWGPKTTVINSGATQKSSLQRFASFLHKDGERKKHFLINLLLVFAPSPTLIVASLFSLQRMIHVMGRAGERVQSKWRVWS